MKTIKDDMPEGTEHEKSVYLCKRVKGVFRTMCSVKEWEKKFVGLEAMCCPV